MEQLTRLRSSRRAYRSHVTRILNKVEETLTKEIDDLALTYLKTAVSQLGKKLEQITKLDAQITELIAEPGELEDTIMESEEVQDLITESINDLNKRVELWSSQRSCTTPFSPPQSVANNEITLDSHQENVSTIASTPQSTTVVDTSVTNVVNEASNTLVNESSASNANEQPVVVCTNSTNSVNSTSVFTSPVLNSVSPYSISVSSVAYPSVSYVHSSGPPPSIPRTTEAVSPHPLAFTDTLTLLPTLSDLNLGATSSDQSYTRVPTVNVRTTESLHGAHPIMTETEFPCQAHQFAANRLPKLTLPMFSGNPLDWLTFWDSFRAAIHLNPNLSGVQKFNYLKAQLQGEAAKAIEGFPLSDRNYAHAVTILQDRFGETDQLIDAHMQSLLELPKPSNNVRSLRSFHDAVESHTRVLSSLGKPGGTYGDMLLTVVREKLPREIKLNIARTKDTPGWSLSQLMSALLKEIRILEYGAHNSLIGSPQSTAAFLVGSKPNRDRKQDKGQPSCIFCKGPHATHLCTVITDWQRRLEIVKQNHLCFNCLARHKVSQCTSKFQCRHCKRKHHTSLCNGDQSHTSTSASTPQGAQPQTAQQPQFTQQLIATQQPVATQQPASLRPATSQPTTTVGSYLVPASHNTPSVSAMCLLKTAVAPVSNDHIRRNANILFDEGAQRSFMCVQLAAELHVKPTTTTQVALSSFGAESQSFQTLDVATIQVETLDGELIPISVLIVPTIATPLYNSCELPLNSLPHLKGLKLANPAYNNTEFNISILIGMDHYWSFVQDHIIRGDGPTAQQSRLGYLLSGPMPNLTTQLSTSIFLQLTTLTDQNQGPNLEQLWSVEAIGTESQKSNPTFLQTYQTSSIYQLPNGTYCAKFPWREDKPDLPSNFNICQRRTKNLLTKLKLTPTLLKLYNDIILEQERRGFIEQVTDSSTTTVHYLSHHPVKKDSPTTPIRIVYDCSCRENPRAASLNDCLMIGPPFLNDLCAILLRFRLHNYALSTDVEKAFLHVKLHEADRDFTRFLWPPQPGHPDSNLQVFRFTSVPFGTASSPFMLHATIDLHLHKYQSPVSEDIRRNIYVDNIISGVDTEAQLIQYYTEARHIMSQANFNLRSWATNSATLQQIATSDKCIDTNTTVHVLGLLWSTLTDTLSLAPKPLPLSNIVSKRNILQDSAQIFDPLGWATPVTIRAKILLQEVWQQKHSWDTPLDKDLCDRWLSIHRDIADLPMVIHSRPYFHHQSGIPDHIYVFADASIKAYGAVAYLHRGSEISLAMSKSRVAPLKSLTLPRLELMAAVSASRVAKFVQTSLSPSNTRIPVRLWTDSQIVLHWLRNGSHAQSFVNQRVNEIIQQFPADTWSFTPSEDNPADLLTRGISTTQLKACKLWTHGPDWLPDATNWPKWTPTNVLEIQASDTVETFPPSTETTSDKKFEGILTVIDPSRYSRLHQLTAVTAYVYRFIHNLKRRQPSRSGLLTSTELSEARRQLIKSIQHSTYPEELAFLLKKTNKSPLLVRQLRLFLDDMKLIRCGGRIHNAPTTDASKFPYLLPNKHVVTRMIVADTHKKLHHGGISITVTALRQVYWIPCIRQCVKSVLRRCVPCRKLIGKPYRSPDPPPLPKVRVMEAPPFTVTGVDFTGALYVKEREETKVYICLFSCAVTRAVHLEVVTDLTVETFLLAFRRFCSRKSVPQRMISDNASTYLAAAEELQRMFNSEELKEALESQNISWQFIPKRAPWYGGFWERIIGLTKQAVKKTLGRTFISLKQLETVVTEVEAMLNDRPLTYLSSDLTDPEPLTPSHLLCGRRIRPIPYPLDSPVDLDDPDFQVNESTVRQTVNRQTKLIQQFWRRWRCEYLTSLREFHRTSGHNKRIIKKGDVVIVHDDKPRLYWRLAVVEDLIEGNDGLVRAAHIRMSNYKTTRPIVRLYPLEILSNDTVEPQIPSPTISSVTEPPQEESDERTFDARPMRRRAATKAMKQISEWTSIIRRAPEDVEN